MIYLIIFIVALVNLFTRALPFIVFKDAKLPLWVIRLGETLPPAIMIILIIYCIKYINLTSYNYGLPELLSIAGIIIVHKLKRNILLSIILGTGLYMFLVQAVFG